MGCCKELLLVLLRQKAKEFTQGCYHLFSPVSADLLLFRKKKKAFPSIMEKGCQHHLAATVPKFLFVDVFYIIYVAQSELFVLNIKVFQSYLYWMALKVRKHTSLYSSCIRKAAGRRCK